MPSSEVSELNEIISDEEFLFRGVLKINWNNRENRISSSAFKDSQGCSVDRCNFRNHNDVANSIFVKKDFFTVAKIQTLNVRSVPTKVKYLPVEDNPYHSEIHDEENRIQLRPSKAKKISKQVEIIHKT
ncbi:hypothetical protein ACEZ3G_08140 [Maribacter algicola]|uniref:Uncharacterized protein n=1 Tax=Meishania litoralis TaxID=3434685 RepID=A0ACC7LIY4_9FLAO